MADNQLIFSTNSPSLAGLAAELSVRLLGVSGQLTGSALAVTESPDVAGQYQATMAGPQGIYGAVLLRSGVAWSLASIPAFRWSGTEFEKTLTAAETQSAAAAAIAAYPVAKPSDLQVSVLPTPLTVNPTPVTVSGGFLPSDRIDLAAARLAAEAVAIGDHTIDYATSTLTQLDAAGNVIAVFDILDEDGNKATSAATAIKRVRRP